MQWNYALRNLAIYHPPNCGAALHRKWFSVSLCDPRRSYIYTHSGWHPSEKKIRYTNPQPNKLVCSSNLILALGYIVHIIASCSCSAFRRRVVFNVYAPFPQAKVYLFHLNDLVGWIRVVYRAPCGARSEMWVTDLFYFVFKLICKYWLFNIESYWIIIPYIV